MHCEVMGRVPWLRVCSERADSFQRREEYLPSSGILQTTIELTELLRTSSSLVESKVTTYTMVDTH